MVPGDCPWMPCYRLQTPGSSEVNEGFGVKEPVSPLRDREGAGDPDGALCGQCNRIMAKSMT